MNETQDYKGQVIATKTNGETKKVLVDDYGKIITSDGGTDGTSITQPTGGTGIRGWLSGIYNTLVTTGVKVLSIPALTAGTNIIGKVGIDPANNSVQLSGSKLEEQFDNTDAVANVITFAENITSIEIYHESATWQSFMVNGITIRVPSGGWARPIGGTPAKTVTIPAGLTCLVGRLI